MNDGMKNLKAFIDQEFEEIQAEADELSEGWSGSIWPQAMQHHQVLRVPFGPRQSFILFIAD